MIDGKLGRGFYYALWNTSTDTSEKTEEFEGYANVLEASNDDSITVGSREDAAKDIYGFMGSLLFVGALLSVAFFIGAVLVIYYKQISEGYEDRDRFLILQKTWYRSKDHQEIHQPSSANCLLLTACYSVYPYRICLQDVS